MTDVTVLFRQGDGAQIMERGKRFFSPDLCYAMKVDMPFQYERNGKLSAVFSPGDYIIVEASTGEVFGLKSFTFGIFIGIKGVPEC